jgi:hypothetical protein
MKYFAGVMANNDKIIVWCFNVFVVYRLQVHYTHGAQRLCVTELWLLLAWLGYVARRFALMDYPPMFHLPNLHPPYLILFAHSNTSPSPIIRLSIYQPIQSAGSLFNKVRLVSPYLFIHYGCFAI